MPVVIIIAGKPWFMIFKNNLSKSAPSISVLLLWAEWEGRIIYKLKPKGFSCQGYEPKSLSDCVTCTNLMVFEGPMATSPASGPVFAQLPGHDHHTRAEGKRAQGIGFNASHHALPHLSTACCPACRFSWGSLGMFELSLSIPGLALNLLRSAQALWIRSWNSDRETGSC